MPCIGIGLLNSTVAGLESRAPTDVDLSETKLD